jgi:hypothetical protein
VSRHGYTARTEETKALLAPAGRVCGHCERFGRRPPTPLSRLNKTDRCGQCASALLALGEFEVPRRIEPPCAKTIARRTRAIREPKPLSSTEIAVLRLCVGAASTPRAVRALDPNAPWSSALSRLSHKKFIVRAEGSWTATDAGRAALVEADEK